MAQGCVVSDGKQSKPKRSHSLNMHSGSSSNVELPTGNHVVSGRVKEYTLGHAHQYPLREDGFAESAPR